MRFTGRPPAGGGMSQPVFQLSILVITVPLTRVKQPPRRGENDHSLMLCLGHRFTPVFGEGGSGRQEQEC